MRARLRVSSFTFVRRQITQEFPPWVRQMARDSAVHSATDRPNPVFRPELLGRNSHCGSTVVNAKPQRQLRFAIQLLPINPEELLQLVCWFQTTMTGITATDEPDTLRWLEFFWNVRPCQDGPVI